MKGLSDWVNSLGAHDLPVLRSTVEAIARLRKIEDTVTARTLAEVVLRDPLMVVKLLRYSQSRRTSRQPTEVTTVEHAIMMHGVAPFFGEFGDLPVLEDALCAHTDALRGALGVISRSHQAAVNARNFAALRHDIESDEVMISALLHDLAELLLWCIAPATIMQIDRMLACSRGLRSAAAQRITLGFMLRDLQLGLAREWRLPRLLQALMDDRACSPRVQTVRLSVALARHSAHGWDDAGLPDDYVGLHKLLGMPLDQVKRRAQQAALQAARAWRHFGIPPAAAWLPMLPGDWPVPELRTYAGVGNAPESVMRHVMDQLARARDHAEDATAVAAVTVFGLEEGMGMRRVWLGISNANGNCVQPRHALLLDPGLLPGDLVFDHGCGGLFDRLMERTQALWYSPARNAKLAALFPARLKEKLGKREFFCMSVRANAGGCLLVYADAGESGVGLDEARYNAFKQICLGAGQALERARI